MYNLVLWKLSTIHILVLIKTSHPQQIAKDIQSKKRIKAINIENVSILFRWAVTFCCFAVTKYTLLKSNLHLQWSHGLHWPVFRQHSLWGRKSANSGTDKTLLQIPGLISWQKKTEDCRTNNFFADDDDAELLLQDAWWQSQQVLCVQGRDNISL